MLRLLLPKVKLLSKDEVQYKELEETLSNCIKGKIATVGILGNHDYCRNWRQAEVAEKITLILEQKWIITFKK
jgi:DNA repair exonuclease SbcCD nuclease subunit